MNNSSPKWLQKIQNNSWEPEIIISGLTIAFVFVIDDSIFNFFAMLIQDTGAEMTALIMYGIFIICLTAIKFVFIVHLLFRGLWVGLVGLSYVYPEGINKQKLPRSQKEVNYSKPSEMVLKVEKISSLLFSVMFVFIFFLFIFILMYTPVILFEMLLIDNYIFYYSAILILLFLMSVAAMIFHNSRMVRKMNNNWINNLVYTISTNAGNKFTLLIFLVLFCFSIVASVGQISSFEFENFKSVEGQNSLDEINPEKYLSERDQDRRISKAAIQSYELNNDFLRLFISDYKTDEVTLRKIKENYNVLKESDFPVDTTNLNVISLFQISIDSVEIAGNDWFQTSIHLTRQKGKLCNIPITGLEKGNHTLRIKKLIWDRIKNDFKVADNWDVISFLIL